MTVDHLSRHMKRDVGLKDFELPIEEVEAGRPIGPANLLFGRVGRVRMRSLWKEAGYSRL